MSNLLLALGPAVSLLLAPRMEQAAGIDTRVEVGSVAPEPEADPEATFATELVPSVAFRFTTLRSALELRADPRLYYRTPNLGDVERPLVVGRAGIEHRYDLRQNLVSSSSVRATYGDIDYTNPGVAFDNPVAGELADPVLRALTVQASTGLGYRFTQRHDLGVRAYVDHTEARGVQLEENDLPVTTSVALDVVQRYRLDPRTSIGFAVRPEKRYISPGADFLLLSTRFGYDRMLDQRTNLSAWGGTVLVKQNEESVRVLPSAMLSLERILVQRLLSRVINRFVATLDAPLDPSTGEVSSTLALEASLTSSFGEHWSLSSGVAGSTQLDEPDIPNQAAETSFAASVALGHRFSSSFLLEGGARYSTRLEDAFGSNPETIDPQAWAFLRLLIEVELQGTDTQPVNQ